MNSDILRAPLIKSAALLAVVSLLVYLTATSAEGSLWSSLGTLLVGTFRVVQLGLGLIVALLFCGQTSVILPVVPAPGSAR